jgi:uncharacterized protein (TIRG00374 family)
VSGSPDTTEPIQEEPANRAEADGAYADRLKVPVVKKGWRSAARNAAIGAVALGVVVAIYAQRSTIAKGIHNFGSLNWAWVVAASLIEVLSMVALALLYRDLLRTNGARLNVTWILAASYTANALSIAVPVIGSGMGGRLAYRRFREGGVSAGAASLTLTVAGIVSTVTLASVVTLSALLSGNPAAAASGLLSAVVLVTVATVIAVELRTEKGQRHLERLITVTVHGLQKVIHRPKGEPPTLAQAVLEVVERMQLGGLTLARLAFWGLVNWWADVACLAFSMWAAGITGLSLGKILLIWAAGAGAATLSPTPAGIGVVEIAMVASMAAVGVRDSSVITAVLVYRIISLKGAVSLWAVVYSGMKHRRLRAGDPDSNARISHPEVRQPSASFPLD